MSLLRILKEREQKRKALRYDAITETRQLASLLRKHYEFESIYICGSILSERFGPHSDIDMIIKGLQSESFFKAHALLLKESTYTIDLRPFEDLLDEFKYKIVAKGMRIG